MASPSRYEDSPNRLSPNLSATAPPFVPRQQSADSWGLKQPAPHAPGSKIKQSIAEIRSKHLAATQASTSSTITSTPTDPCTLSYATGP